MNEWNTQTELQPAVEGAPPSNQLVAEGKTKKASKPGESSDSDEPVDPLASLETFGKADPHVLKVYDMVCNWRKEDTVGYMEKRFTEAADKEKGTSFMKKFGRMI